MSKVDNLRNRKFLEACHLVKLRKFACSLFRATRGFKPLLSLTMTVLAGGDNYVDYHPPR